MKTLILLLLSLAVAIGAMAQTDTKKPDAKKSEKKAVASDDKLKDDLVAKEKTLWDAWSKKDGKTFEEAMAPDTVGVDGSGVTVGRDEAVKQVSTSNCEVKSYNLSDEKLTPIDKDAVVLTYKADQDVTCGGQKVPATIYASSVWKKQGGKWWAAFHQETPAVTPPSQQ